MAGTETKTKTTKTKGADTLTVARRSLKPATLLKHLEEVMGDSDVSRNDSIDSLVVILERRIIEDAKAGS